MVSLFRGGKLVGQFVGAIPENDIREFLTSAKQVMLIEQGQASGPPPSKSN